MADTRQIVSWSLERKCPFRNGTDWFLPTETWNQLADLQTLAESYADNRVFDGICVTGWTIGNDSSDNYFDIPTSGFRIEEKFGQFGGLDVVHKACGNCEANVDRKLDTRIAGCFGNMDIWPDSEELEQQLWQIIQDRNLEDQLRAAFPVTTPLWYGFWVHSPLRRLQAEFLHELLDAACDYDDPRDSDVVHFLNALRAAIDWELPVHVALAPLGHTDFGWYTVFPHCPRCKANAPVGRWQEQFSSEPYECQVCGNVFNPNEHHSSEEYDFDSDSTSLEKQLGENGFEEFKRGFLLHRGCTQQQVEQIVDNENHGPVLRQIAQIRRQRTETLAKLRTSRRTNDRPEQLPRHLRVVLSDDVDLELVLVPAGEFLMGSAESEERPDESPQHRVRIDRPIYLGRFPVTEAQWNAVIGSTSFSSDMADLPVDQVSWLDCQQFCEQLCRRLGKVFRLPSEAEWEYACRAGTTTKYAFGDTLNSDQANFTPYASMVDSIPTGELQMMHELEKRAESQLEERSKRNRRPTPVGSYPPNAWGIYDMHGNVDEWCDDVFHATYEGAPTDGSPWLEGEDKEPSRVTRGGWCCGTEFVCTSTSRNGRLADAGSRSKSETDNDQDDGDETADDSFMAALSEMFYMPIGFRVVCEV
jgi:formylglycine-generating enzyme required for sulfatase activity